VDGPAAIYHGDCADCKVKKYTTVSQFNLLLIASYIPNFSLLSRSIAGLPTPFQTTNNSCRSPVSTHKQGSVARGAHPHPITHDACTAVEAVRLGPGPFPVSPPHFDSLCLSALAFSPAHRTLSELSFNDPRFQSQGISRWPQF
jgi:hypothetical protein